MYTNEKLAKAIEAGEVEWHLHRAFNYAVKHDLEQVTFDELPWGDEVTVIDTIVAQMREYCVEEFYIAEKSTALIYQLGQFLKNGCTVLSGEAVEMKGFMNDIYLEHVLKVKVN